MPDGFRINKRGLDKFTRELNKELQRSAKRNIKPVPVSTDADAGRHGWSVPPAQPTTVVNGPTFYGDVSGQVAWNNSGPVHQHQHLSSGLTATEVADLADLTHGLLTALAEAPDVDGNGDGEVSVATAEARAAAAALWAEAQQAEPDSGRIATMTARLRAALPGLASGIVSSSLVTAVSQLPW